MLISELLTEAKNLYLKNIGKAGMCWCIKVIANQNKTQKEQSDKGQIPYSDIVKQIPEFNPNFFNIPLKYLWKQNLSYAGLDFWWDINDSESRIKAFDKLIGLYEDIDREFVW